MRSVLYTQRAKKDMRRLPRDLADRIRGKLKQLATDPVALANNVSALKGDDALRLRVGDWRTVLELTETKVIVHREWPRGAQFIDEANQ